MQYENMGVFPYLIYESYTGQQCSIPANRPARSLSAVRGPSRAVLSARAAGRAGVGPSPPREPRGAEAFVRQSFVSSSARLVLGKTIGSTGGQVFVETALERLDLLDGGRSTSYLSRPVSVGLRQPLFGFNTYAWQDKIEPLRFEEARREYAEELEGIAIGAAQNFFDL